MNIKQIIIFLLLLSIITIPTNAAVNYIFFPGNDTAVIYNTVNNNWYFKLERVGLEKNTSVLTETINVSAYVNYTLSCGELNFGYNKYKGNHNISSIDYYLINQTTGNENQFNPCGQNLNKNKSYLIKAAAHKESDFDFSILLDLHVYGLSIKELTWWNVSKQNAIHMPIPNGTRPYIFTFNLSNATGTNNQTNIYGNALFNNGFSGINFTLNNITELNYWFNSSQKTSSETQFYVNVTSNATSFDMWYNEGNLGAEVGNASNISKTFMLGDEYSSAVLDPMWSFTNNGVAANTYSLSTNPGKLTMATENTDEYNGGRLIGLMYTSLPATDFEAVIDVTADTGATTEAYGLITTKLSDLSQSFTLGKGYSGSYNNENIRLRHFIDSAYNEFGTAHNENAVLVKIRRVGTVYSGFWSDDGITWTQIGTSQTNTNSYDTLGLFALKSVAISNSATYDNFRVRQYVFPEPPLASWGLAETQASNFSPIPVINTIIIGTFYINTTWINGSGTIITDSFNSTNGTVWINSSLPYRNTSLPPHSWQNLSVYPYNNTYGLNTSALVNKTRIPTNVPVQNTIGNKSVYAGSWLNFTITSTDLDGDSLSYATNATKGTLTTNNFSWLTNISEAGNYTFKFNTTDNFSAVSNEENVSLSVLANLTLISPTNLSTTNSTTITLRWIENPAHPQYTYQIATDYLFLNIVSSGSVIANLTTVDLTSNTQYYWRIKNTTGPYTGWFSFTTPTAAATPGLLNITTIEEQTLTTLSNFTVQLYNSTTTVLTRTTTTGWVNFTAAEVTSSQYFINVIPNSTYARRAVLVTSPANVTVFVPNAATSTVDVISFDLMDYTNKFPWTTSYSVVTKNNSVIHSSYFDADAKVTVYLIRGQSYTITLYNGNNIKQWGNYISIENANVQMVIMESGFNTATANPYVQQITSSNSNITLTWSAVAGTLNLLNFSVYKGDMNTLVHNIVTTVGNGQIEYIITNTSDIYYVFAIADTSIGRQELTKIIDYRSGTRTGGIAYTWNYGNYSVPLWVYTVFSLMAIILLAGGFGALHRGEGAIITAFAALFFAYKGWLSMYTGGIGMIVGLLLFAILYHLDSRRKGGY